MAGQLLIPVWRLHACVSILLIACDGRDVSARRRGSLRAQTAETGQIAGTVSDPSKAVVPQAKVTVTNSGTGFGERSTNESASGAYSVTLLPPGNYLVTVEAPASRRPTTRMPWCRWRQPLRLTSFWRSDSHQQVTVEANAEVFRPRSPPTADTTTGKTVIGLPLTNRNYTQILGLNPGVASPVPNAAQFGKKQCGCERKRRPRDG